MGRPATFAFAALLSSSLAFPALAALEPLGTAEISVLAPYDVEHPRVMGDRVTLTARNADVMCSSVTATFGNGRTREIFRGYLSRDEATTMGYPAASA